MTAPLGQTAAMTSGSGSTPLLRDDDVGLVSVSSRIREPGRKRFTVAHEIGHFVLRHTGELSCGAQALQEWHGAGSEAPEAEANRFAAELLMPRRLTRVFMDVGDFEYSVVSRMAEKLGVTLTAAAIRWVQLTAERCAAVRSSDRQVRWAVRSASFGPWIERGHVPGVGSSAHEWAGTAGLLHPTMASVTPSAWLDPEDLRGLSSLLEQSVGMPAYDGVLTLLRIDDDLDVDAESEGESSILPSEGWRQRDLRRD